MKYIAVKNWKQLQHYKDRNPPWIKLHREWLDHYEFSCLPDASKAHLMLIWLLASQLDNKIPDDPEWLKSRLGTKEEINLTLLIDKGFLARTQDASMTPAKCSPEERQRREENIEKPINKIDENGFDEILKYYPVDRASEAARKSYQNAIYFGGATHDQLLRGVKAAKIKYADTEKQYIPSLKRFIDEGYWKSKDILDHEEPPAQQKENWEPWKVNLAKRIGENNIKHWFNGVRVNGTAMYVPKPFQASKIRDEFMIDIEAVFGKSYEIKVQS